MITIDGRSSRYCDGLSRRSFLRIGALGVGAGALTLADILRAEAQTGSDSRTSRHKAVINVFLCPSAVHAGGQRDAADPNDPVSKARGVGYGYQDYGATCYTDIDPNGQTGQTGSTAATPFRNKNARVNGLLKQGKTTAAEVIERQREIAERAATNGKVERREERPGAA